MQKSYLELLGIVLDSLSFFLVTTDLYGEERLRRLGNSLESSSRRRINPDGIFISILTCLLVASFCVFYLHYKQNVTWYKQNFPLASALSHDLAGPIVIVLAILAWGLTILIVLLLSRLTSALAHLIQTKQMKGVFIVSGTILFGFARLAAILQLNSEK